MSTGDRVPRRRNSRSGAAREPAFPALPPRSRPDAGALLERGWSPRRRLPDAEPHPPRPRVHHQVRALEICDGLMIHPLVGATKSDDIPAAVRMQLLRGAPSRTTIPKDRVLLSIYPAAMRYARPARGDLPRASRARTTAARTSSSAAITPASAATTARYDAQEIFEQFAPGELGITPLNFENAFYSTAVGAMGTAKTAPGDASTQVSLSGTKVRELLRAGSFRRPSSAVPRSRRFSSIDAGRMMTGRGGRSDPRRVSSFGLALGRRDLAGRGSRRCRSGFRRRRAREVVVRCGVQTTRLARCFLEHGRPGRCACPTRRSIRRARAAPPSRFSRGGLPIS